MYIYIFFSEHEKFNERGRREVEDMGKRMGVMKERERSRRWACSNSRQVDVASAMNIS